MKNINNQPKSLVFNIYLYEISFIFLSFKIINENKKNFYYNINNFIYNL